jgi:hypothetical protein
MLVLLFFIRIHSFSNSNWSCGQRVPYCVLIDPESETQTLVEENEYHPRFVKAISTCAVSRNGRKMNPPTKGPCSDESVGAQYCFRYSPLKNV